MKFSVSAVVFGSLLLSCGLVRAQSFGAAPSEALPTQKEPTGLSTDSPLSLAKPAVAPKQAQPTTTEDKVFIPQGALSVLNTPTTDGSKRGGVGVRGIDRYGRPIPSSKIFMYYDNFRISRSMGGLTTCDVRFFVNNNLDSRLVSLDVKLVWPGLTTALSFSDINPNSPTYYNYTLMGDGCYTMDKMPNIVVNRCRVKGLSSAECAGRIVWLKAN